MQNQTKPFSKAYVKKDDYDFRFLVEKDGVYAHINGERQPFRFFSISAAMDSVPPREFLEAWTSGDALIVRDGRTFLAYPEQDRKEWATFFSLIEAQRHLSKEEQEEKVEWCECTESPRGDIRLIYDGHIWYSSDYQTNFSDLRIAESHYGTQFYRVQKWKDYRIVKQRNSTFHLFLGKQAHGHHFTSVEAKLAAEEHFASRQWVQSWRSGDDRIVKDGAQFIVNEMYHFDSLEAAKKSLIRPEVQTHRGTRVTWEIDGTVSVVPSSNVIRIHGSDCVVSVHYSDGSLHEFVKSPISTPREFRRFWTKGNKWEIAEKKGHGYILCPLGHPGRIRVFGTLVAAKDAAE